jgi:predicted dehydrogenase
MEKQGNGAKGQTRREFMAASAVFAAPLILPASVLGREGTVAPSERINVGLIGAGGQGRGLGDNAIHQPDVQLTMVSDLNRRTLTQATRMVGDYYGNRDTKAFTDYRELLEQDGLDAVIIATPDHWHALISIAAAGKKKDIYCEKPLTWSLGEGRAVVKAVRDNGIVFQTGSMQRSGREFKQACEIIRNGYMGKIKHINVCLPDFGDRVWADSFPEPPRHLDWEFYVGPAVWTPFHPERYDWNWRWWMGFGGGQMMDWIGHHGDIAHMAMGWDNTGPVEVDGVLWEMPPANERNNLYDAPAGYRFECRYADGTTMTVANRSNMPAEYAQFDSLGTQFINDKGEWLYVDRGKIASSPESILKVDFKESDFRFRREPNHMRDFLDCVKSREEPIAPVEAGHRSASIGHLGKIACTLGAKLQWDPATETFTDNPALNGMLTRKYRGEWKLG